MEDIYVIDPDQNIPDSESQVLSEVNRTITPATTEEIPSEDICTANSAGLTAHKLLTAEQGLTCTSGFISTSSSGIKFFDNSIQTTAFGLTSLGWQKKIETFTAELYRRYVVIGDVVTNNVQVTLPSSPTNGSYVDFSTDLTGGLSFKIKVATGSGQTINGLSEITVDSTLVNSYDIFSLIYFNGIWNIYDIGSGGGGGGGGGGTPGGSNTQVQYNSSGSFAGSSNLTFDGSTLTSLNLTVSNTFNCGTVTSNVINMNHSLITTNSYNNITSNSGVIVDSISISNYRSAKYFITGSTDGNEYQSSEIITIHYGPVTSTCDIVDYAILYNGTTPIMTFDCSITASLLNLIVYKRTDIGILNVKFSKIINNI